jgi:hypothetical protein
MRILIASIFAGFLATQAQAAPAGYDLYLLACDGLSDCQRVANLALGADGQKSQHPTPGVNVRIEPLSTLPEGAVIRMAMTLNPAELVAGGATAGRGNGGPVNIQVDSAILHQGYYSPLLVFSAASKVYQLWGRQLAAPAVGMLSGR